LIRRLAAILTADVVRYSRLDPIWESHHGKGTFIRSLPFGARLLDVGCGNNSPAYVKQIRPDLYYIGIDVNDYNQGNGSLSLADEYHISSSAQFPQNIERFVASMDAVISSHNLEHCHDCRAVLRAMVRALKPGGRMYLSFPCEASARFPHRRGCLNFFDDDTHQNLLPWHSITDELTELGMIFDFRARRYRPLALAVVGLFYEPLSAIRKEVAGNGATWALYGFESVIWARRATRATEELTWSNKMLARLRAAFANGRKSVPSADAKPIGSDGSSLSKNTTLQAGDQPAEVDYQKKLTQEISTYKEVENVHDLPDIFHYWSNKYVLPMCIECGFARIDEFFASNLYAAAALSKNHKPRFISIGSGNCDLEVEIANLLREKGLAEFSLECLELNPHMLARGRRQAEREGVANHLIFTEGDFNTWRPGDLYAGVMANHSLHHVVNLEGLFDGIKLSLEPTGYFVTADMIGRNGHQRWPEALEIVQAFWQELPASYRYNQQLKRHEDIYLDWDCSNEGFEGVRAQDILPLLIERFDFSVFLGFSNVVTPFVDRSFGHNFDATSEWDRVFIDRVHAVDEEGFATGRLKPTQMTAVMTPGPAASHLFSRGISPEMAVRRTRI
jgi:SAM-dependent methyltransferase